MRIIKKLGLGLLLLGGMNLSANYLTVNGSVETMEFAASVDMYTDISSIKKLNINAGIMDNDFNDSLYSVGLSVDNFSNDYEYLKLTLGAKLVFNSMDKVGEEFLSVPFGVELDGIVLNDKDYPVGIKLGAYYAPDFLSLKDTLDYFEYKGELYTMLTKEFQLYLGYRDISTNYITKDVSYTSDIYGGLKFLF